MELTNYIFNSYNRFLVINPDEVEMAKDANIYKLKKFV